MSPWECGDESGGRASCSEPLCDPGRGQDGPVFCPILGGPVTWKRRGRSP